MQAMPQMGSNPSMGMAQLPTMNSGITNPPMTVMAPQTQADMWKKEYHTEVEKRMASEQQVRHLQYQNQQQLQQLQQNNHQLQQQTNQVTQLQQQVMQLTQQLNNQQHHQQQQQQQQPGETGQSHSNGMFVCCINSFCYIYWKTKHENKN